MSLNAANTFITLIMLIQCTFSITLSLVAKDGVSLSLSLGLSQLVCFILPSAFYLVAARKKPSEAFLFKPLSLKNAAYAAGLAVLIQPGAMALSALTSIFFPNNVTEALSAVNSEGTPLTAAFLMCALPALCEETALRGAAAEMLRQNAAIKGALLNGLYFALIHLNPHQFFYTFALGVMLYLLLAATKTIGAPMLAHFVINLSQLALFYAASPYAGNEEVSPGASLLPAALFAAISTAAFILLFIKFVKSNGLDLFKCEAREKILSPTFAMMIITYAAIMLLYSF